MSWNLTSLSQRDDPANQIDTKRDITIIELDRDYYLIIGCDVSGGIGPRAGDQVSSPAEIVGAFTTRVALMEVMAVGARPLSIVNNLTTSFKRGGAELLAGIKKEIRAIGLSEQVIIGSTEDNIKTEETGVGITVIGIVPKEKLISASSQPGDLIISLGIPLVGADVLAKEEKIADLADLIKLNSLEYIDEIIPVGSKGINYEANLLAQLAGLELKKDSSIESQLDLLGSAGPGTVLLVSLSQNKLADLEELFTDKPLNIIGQIV